MSGHNVSIYTLNYSITHMVSCNKRPRGRPPAVPTPPPPTTPNPPASAQPKVQRRREHRLVNMGVIGRAAVATGRGITKGAINKRAKRPKGTCIYIGCPWPDSTSQYRCPSCTEGKGAWYHLECFFDCHPCSGGTDK